MLGKAMSVSFLPGPLNILTRLGRGTMRRGNEDCEQESDSQLVCGTCGGALFSAPTVRYPPCLSRRCRHSTPCRGRCLTRPFVSSMSVRRRPPARAPGETLRIEE